jgi:hypothetical protein
VFGGAANRATTITSDSWITNSVRERDIRERGMEDLLFFGYPARVSEYIAVGFRVKGFCVGNCGATTARRESAPWINRVSF